MAQGWVGTEGMSAYGGTALRWWGRPVPYSLVLLADCQWGKGPAWMGVLPVYVGTAPLYAGNVPIGLGTESRSGFTIPVP
jgi:hypothetical protein